MVERNLEVLGDVIDSESEALNLVRTDVCTGLTPVDVVDCDPTYVPKDDKTTVEVKNNALGFGWAK